MSQFNKEEFSELLQKAQGNRSLNQFGLKSGVDPGYISRFINLLRNSPPSPEILQKLADAAHNEVTYADLMQSAGYIEKDIDNKIIKGTPEEQDIVPEEFTNADEARAYVNKHQIFGSGGFDADKLDDEEILEFANALLEQMKMVSYKYKK
ncbi:helix-turn-helix transcriptional regulator [Tissierella sp.]|uniref:helix-turn-helix transcriptional regulator n=1 Tax=Tissierella sp. TaxID=41274 RepID=UPI00286543AC|nr:helix-turn-helix transcriptional regulator [Tissierella sp.]MDR7856342.1 helix-turn-helix transcriptional regulator [Tissierella sp.]